MLDGLGVAYKSYEKIWDKKKVQAEGEHPRREHSITWKEDNWISIRQKVIEHSVWLIREIL